MIYNNYVMLEDAPNTKPDTSMPNTSGQGFSAIVPPELQGWNWGAFLLTWVWGIGNRVWLALLALVPIPMAGLAVSILLGVKGNEWAWQFKKWDSIEQFRRTQRIWLYWGIASLLAPFVLIIGIILIIVGILGYYGYIKF
jgi:hypothetical protein